MLINSNIKIGLIGLGYVGLPLAALFATKYHVWAFDISNEKIELLSKGKDSTGLMASHDILNPQLHFTSFISDLTQCDFLIVTIPTDIDKSNKPNLGPLKNASTMIGAVMKKGDYGYI